MSISTGANEYVSNGQRKATCKLELEVNVEIKWGLTVQLGDASGRKITTESLRFSTREHALQGLARISHGAILKPQEVYTIENEEGEQISFLGGRYISHSLLQLTEVVEEEEYPF